MNYSKFLTQKPVVSDIERVNWSEFVDVEYVYEFNYIATIHQLFATSLFEVEDVIEAVLWGFDPEKKAVVSRDKSLVHSIKSNGPTYQSLKVLVEKDMSSLALPSNMEEWDISYNELKNYAVATKELDSGLICVNIAMFGNPR